MASSQDQQRDESTASLQSGPPDPSTRPVDKGLAPSSPRQRPGRSGSNRKEAPSQRTISVDLKIRPKAVAPGLGRRTRLQTLPAAQASPAAGEFSKEAGSASQDSIRQGNRGSGAVPQGNEVSDGESDVGSPARQSSPLAPTPPPTATAANKSATWKETSHRSRRRPQRHVEDSEPEEMQNGATAQLSQSTAVVRHLETATEGADKTAETAEAQEDEEEEEEEEGDDDDSEDEDRMSSSGSYGTGYDFDAGPPTSDEEWPKDRPDYFAHLNGKPYRYYIDPNTLHRSKCFRTISKRGGIIVKSPERADIVLVDTLISGYGKLLKEAANHQARLVRLNWVRDCRSSHRRVKKRPEHIPTPEYDPMRFQRGVRRQFSKQDDEAMIEYLKEQIEECEDGEKVYLAGTAIWQSLAQKNPRHTYQSWRNHYVSGFLNERLIENDMKEYLPLSRPLALGRQSRGTRTRRRSTTIEHMDSDGENEAKSLPNMDMAEDDDFEGAMMEIRDESDEELHNTRHDPRPDSIDRLQSWGNSPKRLSSKIATWRHPPASEIPLVAPPPGASGTEVPPVQGRGHMLLRDRRKTDIVRDSLNEDNARSARRAAASAPLPNPRVPPSSQAGLSASGDWLWAQVDGRLTKSQCVEIMYACQTQALGLVFALVISPARMEDDTSDKRRARIREFLASHPAVWTPQEDLVVMHRTQDPKDRLRLAGKKIAGGLTLDARSDFLKREAHSFEIGVQRFPFGLL